MLYAPGVRAAAASIALRMSDANRPPHAVVGSHKIDEEMFGKVFDPRVVQRIWHFVQPYRREVIFSVIAVLVFTATQLSIPLIIRYAIDNGLNSAGGSRSALLISLLLFVVVIIINFCASYLQALNWKQECRCQT